MFATEKPCDADLVHGRDPAHGRHRQCPRQFCIALLATGNVGGFGNGANIFRGHCNVQGATDLGLDITTLPLYYGLAEGAWRHWCRVWETDYDWMAGRFHTRSVSGKPVKMMEAVGIPSTRWFDATMLPQEQVQQQDNVKAMIVFGHGGNTVTRMPKAAEGIAALDLLVVADPHPTTWAVLGERKDNTYLLPICTQFECDGSRTASNRSLQWGEQVVKPIFESKNDYDVMYMLAHEARLRRPDVQEHQGRERRGLGRGHPARDQPRRLVDRLLRPVAGTPEGAHEEPGQVRPGLAARAEGHPRDRRRLLRPAVAVLGHAGTAASRHPPALQHQPARHGRRRYVPRPLWRRA